MQTSRRSRPADVSRTKNIYADEMFCQIQINK